MSKCYVIMCKDSKVNKTYPQCVFNSIKLAKTFLNTIKPREHEQLYIEQSFLNEGHDS